jgi:hypothetical protein
MSDENIAQAVNHKDKAYKKYFPTNKVEDKTDYQSKRVVSKREILKKHKVGKNLWHI